MLEVQEYKPVTKTSISLEDPSCRAWEELCKYAKFLGNWAELNGIEDIPEVTGDNIDFKSFIGTYYPENEKISLTIKLDPNKISKSIYISMVSEIDEWCNLLGPTIHSRFAFFSPIDILDRTLSFSNQLLKLTELTRNSFLTPIIQNKTITAPISHGRMNLVKTSRQLSQGSTEIVSIKTKVIIETLPLLLLLRFNLEISYELMRFINEIKLNNNEDNDIQISLERIARQNVLFHQDLLFNPRFRYMIEYALDIDYYKPEILDETYRQSHGNAVFHDLIYLWEAYISGKTLQTSLLDEPDGDYTLKPMSKIYELWLLKIIDTILQEEFCRIDISCSPIGSMTLQYSNGNRHLILNYNQNIPRKWKQFRPRYFSMRPDFVLAEKIGRKKIPVLIADAKYKQSPTSSDKQQMLAYMLATGWNDSFPTMKSALLSIGRNDLKKVKKEYKRESPNAELYELIIRPEIDLSYLRNLIKTSYDHEF